MMKKKYLVLVFLLVLLIIGFHLLYPLILSYQYNLPFNYVFNNITKHSIGSLIFIIVNVYDPTDVVKVTLGPENIDTNSNELIRIEHFLGDRAKMSKLKIS